MSENREIIREWVLTHFKGNFTVDFNDSDEIIINGNCHLKDFMLKELPYKFAVVNGDFNLGGDKFPREGQVNYRDLASLKNCPDEVKGTFSCHYCYNLESLEGGPKTVGGDYVCSKCNLHSLDHIAETVNGYIIAFGNYELTDISALNDITFGHYLDIDFANKSVRDTSTYQMLSERNRILNDNRKYLRV